MAGRTERNPDQLQLFLVPLEGGQEFLHHRDYDINLRLVRTFHVSLEDDQLRWDHVIQNWANWACTTDELKAYLRGVDAESDDWW